MSAWLIPGSRAVHPLYEKIWTAVQKGNFADTPTFSRLLMTSGLSTDSLGFIWSLANQTVAGMMTQQEVYFVFQNVINLSFPTSNNIVNSLAGRLFFSCSSITLIFSFSVSVLCLEVVTELRTQI